MRFLLIGRDVNLANPSLSGIVPPELENRFVFTGQRSDPERLLQAMDVYCSSSWSEAFPNVLGEAMACGVPCVTTDVGDSADIVGDTGVVVEPSNPEALTDGLLKVLHKSSGKRRRLGKYARRRIEKYFSISCIAEQYSRLYSSVLNSS